MNLAKLAKVLKLAFQLSKYRFIRGDYLVGTVVRNILEIKVLKNE